LRVGRFYKGVDLMGIGLVTFWSHALAAVLFVALAGWQLARGVREPGQRLLLAAFAVTALWAWMEAILPADTLTHFAETGRNLIWIAWLYHLAEEREDESRQKGIRLVYGAVAAVLGIQFLLDIAPLVSDLAAPKAAMLLRMTAAAGALVLVHNVYGQAAPSSRPAIRYVVIGLSALWLYDLNFYTLAYVDAAMTGLLADWRGLAAALTTPLFALGARSGEALRVRLSRAATFQSLSLLAICAYLAVVAILATAFRETGAGQIIGNLAVLLLALVTVALMVILPSSRARAWAKVKIAKHFFEHRYDYRAEWLRFTATLGEPGAAPMGQRVIKAFADMLDAPGGLVLITDDNGALERASSWNWQGNKIPPVDDCEQGREFWQAIAVEGRILELDGLRKNWASPADKALPVPQWLIDDAHAWVGIPLQHNGLLVGLVVLGAPAHRRALDWEDFDLMKTAGKQAASNFAEALGQEALAKAQRFEEFNRRFAFIMHDIKNLVSQLSLLSRNAERHADNPDFRADMVATLKGSVGKMNTLLARLSPGAQSGEGHAAPTRLKDIVAFAIAAKRRDHEVMLVGDSDVWALADGAQLEQALGHLIQNAVDASDNGEPVIVRVEPAGTDVAITVADRGEGMDADFVRTRLFEPFVSTKDGGFGIGAYEARSLVHAMGGRLSVESRRDDGTSFTIHLPAARAPQMRKSA
ncbi:MAG: PEP-CTERM system histidine kinase PrsK, partial [Sphingomonadaceae bacterium]